MILVTGGTGLVGAHLLLHLLENGANTVRAIYRDSKNTDKTKALFNLYEKEALFEKIEWVSADILDIPALEIAFQEVDYVYHCAALISFDPAEEVNLRKVNIEGTANIVNFCIDKKVKKLCHVSSIAALGDLLTSENKNTNQTPNLPNTNLTSDKPRDKDNQIISPATSNKFFNFQQELTPEYEQTVIKQLRTLRQQQRIAIRFILIIILVPLLVQFISKNFVFSPVLNYFGVDRAKISEVYISQEIGEKYLREFARLQEIQEIKHVLGVAKVGHESEETFREQVQELFREAGYESQDGWKNLLSDITGVIAFIAILIFGRQQLAITRAYLSRYFLSLNDITKAFIFILFTDIFVGFHSAEGWTVILETLFRHFGWRENITFISLFVATVPVILDTIFKLLIFNYLTRKSPTAATILEKMNQ